MKTTILETQSLCARDPFRIKEMGRVFRNNLRGTNIVLGTYRMVVARTLVPRFFGALGNVDPRVLGFDMISEPIQLV